MRSDPEPWEELLISLCRLTFDDDLKFHIGTLLGSVNDWPALVSLINEHGIASLAYTNLQSIDLLSIVPKKEREILRQSHLISLARNSYLLDRFSEAAGYLSEQGIDVILLKGMALELSLYGNCGLRQMNDVDILVDSSLCLKARKVLLGRGFRSIPLRSPLLKMIPMYYGKHLPELIRDDLTVEIHHRLFRGEDNITPMVVSESSKLLINKQKLGMPPVDLHFLYLVSHLYSHEIKLSFQLRLYTDLFLMVEKHGMEVLTPRIFDLAEETGRYNYLLERLFLLSRFWGASLPVEITSLFGNIDREAVITGFLSFLPDPRGREPEGPGPDHIGNIREIPGTWHRIIFILSEVFPSLSFMKVRYNLPNRWVGVFAYPYRWGTIISRLFAKN